MSDSVTQTPPPAPATGPAPATTRRRRWPKVLFALVLLLLALAWFAPAIIANTALRNHIARRAGADLNGHLELGGASLGWLSPLELRGVTLTDTQGRVVARIEKVTSSRTLLGLLRDRSNVGEFTLEHPTIEVAADKNGTNLEDVLRKILDNPAAPSGATRSPLTVRITGGTVIVKDAETGRTGEFRDVEATVVLPALRSEPITAKVTASAPGRVEADVSIAETSRVKFLATGCDLENFAVLLRRVAPGAGLAGALSADATATWGGDSAGIDGTLGVRNFALTAPELKGDTLRMASAELPLKVSVSAGTARVERANLTSDLGSASVAGTFPVRGPVAKLFDQPGITVGATLDLAKIAATLPKLLRVRDGTEFQAGQVVLKVESKPTEGGTAWSGNVTSSALQATRAGKNIRWDEPLAIEFTGRVAEGQLPTFDKLTCKSEFIAVNAQLKPDSVRAAANVYLDKLAERLKDFVDLGDAALDGRGTAWVIATRTPEGAFKADAAMELTQFAFTDRTGKGVREPALKLQVTATGTAPGGGPVGLATATAALTAAGDELHLKLLDAVPDVKQLTGGTLDVRLVGDLARWRTRALAVVPALEDYQLGGTGTVHGVARFSPESVKVDRLSLAVQKARFVARGIDLDEPNLNGAAALTVDRKARTATFDNFTLNSAALTVTNGKLVVAAPKGGEVVVQAGGPAVADLNRLGRMTGLSVDPQAPTAPRGRATGPVRVRYAGDAVTFAATLDVTDFAVGPVKKPDWTEPKLRVEVDGSYTQSTDTLAFTAAKLERPGLALDATGTMSKFASTTDANLTGTVTYDMAKLTPKLRELLGGNFAAEGKGTKPATFAGSLTPVPKPGQPPPNPYATLAVELGLGWDSAQAYGFEMGAGELRTKLANGTARVTPIVATFGGGKVTVRPTIHLDPMPGALVLGKGLMVDRAKLTPTACAGAIGYALPAIANSGKAEGEVSVVIDDNRVPFSDPSKATAKGTVIIHKATVTGGPMITELVKLLGADNVTMTLANEQSVPVRVENGRVYHENLSIKIGAYVVKTTGSVGFDNTLELVADVPIPGGLPGLKNTPAIAKALTGKRVQVPIKGTLAKPMLDPKQFQVAVAKLAEGAAKDIGKDLLRKELDKLFPGGGGAMPGGGTNPGGGLFPFPLPKK